MVVGYTMNILDNGSVSVLEHMGSDLKVAQMAWVSTGKTDGDHERLIRYLMKHKHLVPFEHCKVTFKVKAPITVLRQWMRHRTGAFSEASARMVPIQDAYVPARSRMVTQSDFTKQGSSAEMVDCPDVARDLIIRATTTAMSTYESLLGMGVNMETARQVLPQSAYSSMYWTVDLRNLFGFLELRMDSHAQWEIRQYANAIAALTKELYPLCYDAWEKGREG